MLRCIRCHLKVYEGPCPELWLRRRAAEVVLANPWLAGRLRTHPQTKKLALWVGPEAKLQSCLEVVPMPNREDVVCNCSPDFFVKPNVDLVDRDEPVCRILVLTEPTNQRWGLQMSMSHVFADGHTFYAIYGMLGSGADVWSMDAARLSFSPMTSLEAPFHGKWLFLALQHLRFRMRWQTGIRPIVRCRFVHDEWIQQQKATFAAEPDAAFLSSNDLFSATQPACGIMLLNMRSRMPGLENQHAGCYAALVILFPEEYKSPANIRRVVVRKSPACTPKGAAQWPGWSGGCGMVSSWHTLYQDAAFKDCKQLTHFPCGPRNEACRYPWEACHVDHNCRRLANGRAWRLGLGL